MEMICKAIDAMLEGVRDALLIVACSTYMWANKHHAQDLLDYLMGLF